MGGYSPASQSMLSPRPLPPIPTRSHMVGMPGMQGAYGQNTYHYGHHLQGKDVMVIFTHFPEMQLNLCHTSYSSWLVFLC